MKNFLKLLFVLLIASCSKGNDIASEQNPVDPVQEIKLLAFKKPENSNSSIPTK